jgi:tetratricopeptide (TPR) repeat protein
MEEQVFLAKDYLERGKAQHSIQMLERMQLVPEKSEHLEALIVLVESYNKADKDEEALQLARELLRLHPKDNDVQDCVVHLFSSFRDSALEAEELSLELRKEYPERSYYCYMLAYLGHTWLPRSREYVLGNLDEALRLCGRTRYLKTAFEIYHSYGLEQERADCVALMVEQSPADFDTRRCLVLEKIYTKQYQDAAQLGVELLMDYPQESWLLEKIDEVKDLLYGNRYEQFIQQAYWRVEKRIEDTNSQIVAYFYLICFYLVLAVTAFAGLIVAPFFIVKFLVVDDSLHIERLQTDDLYRKLTEVSDIVQRLPNGIVFLLTEVTNSQKVLIFDDDKIVIANGLRCSFRELRTSVELEALVKPKVFQVRDVSEITIRDTEFTLSFGDLSRLDKDFSFLSLDVPRELREFLEQKAWSYEGKRIQKKIEILYFCLLFLLLDFAILYWDWPGAYGFELQVVCSTVVFVNGLVYLWHRLKKPIVSEVYTARSSESGIEL